MAYIKHEHFTLPEDKNAIIWRYMDLAKFISILNNKALYFPRIDILADVDPFEGYYTKLNLAFGEVKFDQLPNEVKEQHNIKTPARFNGFTKAVKKIIKFANDNRKTTFVNSWHLQNFESAAMWKFYLSNNEGIAIQSTCQKFIDSLSAYNDFEIFIGKISYLDYKVDAIPFGNVLFPFMHKRQSFHHENELRALIWTPQHGKNDMENPEKNKYKDTPGLHVAVDLETLIEKIYIAPSAPEWLAKLIESIIEKFNIKKDVYRSDLASSPIK